MDKKTDNVEGIRRIETFRSGVFVFQVGLDPDVLAPLLERVGDVHRLFSSMPILPDIASSLEREVIASSVYGTNTIEGATLTEEETAAVLDMSPEIVENEDKRRVTNIRTAYSTAERFADDCHTSGRSVAFPDEHVVKHLHSLITEGISHPYNKPGEYRDNVKGFPTRVGDSPHGSAYSPPKCRDDIDLLMTNYLDWLNSEPVVSLDPILRAPLAHYYFELIHPFWDGNGRVGRVVEALILKCAGFKYSPFAMARYYLEHLDDYFRAFSIARKAAEKNAQYPNTTFVTFFLAGLREVLERLHGRVSKIVGLLVYRDQTRSLLDEKRINERQYAIVTSLMALGPSTPLQQLRQQPWYQALYVRLTDKTRKRDLKGLQQHGLIHIGADQRVNLMIAGS